MSFTAKFDRYRTVIAFVAGPAVTVVLISATSGLPFLGMIVSLSIIALPLVVCLVLPLYVVLRLRQQLRIWWAVLLGASLAVLPDLLISLSGLGSNFSLYAHGHQLITNGSFTSEGLYHFFVWRPTLFLPYGAIGGLVSWLILFGCNYPGLIGPSVCM